MSGDPTPDEDASAAEPAPPAVVRRPRPDAPVVPDRAAEDRPEAWGERGDEDDDDRFLRERPPHW